MHHIQSSFIALQRWSSAPQIDGKDHNGRQAHGQDNEWASHSEGVGAWIKLSWSIPQNIDRVLLFDRPNVIDQIIAGELEFSDGSKISVEELPNDAVLGREVKFPTRKVDWVKFIVTDVKEGSPNIGLSEMAVFQAEDIRQQM